MDERAFRLELSRLIGAYEPSRQSGSQAKAAAWDREWTDLLRCSTEDQSRRALDLLELHVANGFVFDNLESPSSESPT